MCYISFFFEFLMFYFVLLVFVTLLRKDVTYNGIFYIFTIYLYILVVYLVTLHYQIVLSYTVPEFNFLINLVTWGSLELSISLSCDIWGFFYLSLVLVIGFGTNIDALNYLTYEAREDFFVILNWFIFSMIILVLANNLFTLFLVWESVGLLSFFLINFWSTQRGASNFSFNAFFFYNISDVFLFMFIVLIHYTTYLNNLTVINYNLMLNFFEMSNLSNVAVYCLVICTLLNSAQLIGRLWLPDSTEALVPASALIHSATLVSAGIYLLLSFIPITSYMGLQNI